MGPFLLFHYHLVPGSELLQVWRGIIPVVMVLSLWNLFRSGSGVEDFFRRHGHFSVLILLAILLTWTNPDITCYLIMFYLASRAFTFWWERQTKKNTLTLSARRNPSTYLQKLQERPTLFVALSFIMVILMGTGLLSMPQFAEGEELSLADAFFMAVSATCVTGLATKSLASDLSTYGQIVILLLVQVGSLSIMTLYSSFMILMGKSMGMKDVIAMQEGLFDLSTPKDFFQMVNSIIKYTLFFELLGGCILTIAFIIEDFELGSAIYYGFFHAISAFCNAGFTLFDKSLEDYATNPLVNLTISALIILGGLGFIVLRELHAVVRSGSKQALLRMGIHTKIVLITSAVLVIGGSVLIFFGEYFHALKDYTLWQKTQIAFFQSVTLRTAGFNTIPLTDLQQYTLYIMTLFMFVGGSPGSTAGGIKTTTLAVLLLSIRSTWRGEKAVTVFKRTIPGPVVVRVVALMFVSLLITSFFIPLLMFLVPGEKNFLQILFEVFSASGTVGLSLGVTQNLTLSGKIAISILMFLGRIGPLALVLAFARRGRELERVDYPDGRIMIG